jgi:outer membrane protein assembly factor BamB
MLIALLCSVLAADPLWTTGLPEVPQGSVWVDDKGESVIVQTMDGHIVKVDAITGRKLWERGLGSFAVCDLAVGDGRMLAAGGGRGKTVKCFDLEGKHLWEKKVKNVLGLAINGDMAVVQALDGRILAYDAATGAQKWQTRLIPPSTVAPILGADAVIAADGQGTVFWLDIVDGSELKKLATTHTILRMAFTADGLLVCLSEAGTLTVWDKAGEKVWQVEGMDAPSDMIISGDRLLVADAFGEITAYGLEHGTVEWHAQLEEPLASHLWCDKTGRWLIAGGANGTVKVWKQEDGSEVTRFKVAKRAGMVASAGDTVLVGSNEMKLRAYEMEPK